MAARASHLFLVALAATLVLFSGCGQPTETGLAPGFVEEPGDPIEGPLPTMEKLQFSSSPPPQLPLLIPATPAANLSIAKETLQVQLAFDFASEADSALTLRLEDPSGNTLYEDEVAAAGKFVMLLRDVVPSEVRFFAQSDASWSVGLVATSFPVGFIEGLRLWVSEPAQTQIEHAFHPDRLEASAGATTRITLSDFDPHAGIENLQHNLYFESLGLRTKGKTTWGEVRVLDVPALNPGEYAFSCEFHGFTGTLAVS